MTTPRKMMKGVVSGPGPGPADATFIQWSGTGNWQAWGVDYMSGGDLIISFGTDQDTRELAGYMVRLDSDMSVVDSVADYITLTGRSNGWFGSVTVDQSNDNIYVIQTVRDYIGAALFSSALTHVANYYHNYRHAYPYSEVLIDDTGGGHVVFGFISRFPADDSPALLIMDKTLTTLEQTRSIQNNDANRAAAHDLMLFDGYYWLASNPLSFTTGHGVITRILYTDITAMSQRRIQATDSDGHFYTVANNGSYVYTAGDYNNKAFIIVMTTGWAIQADLHYDTLDSIIRVRFTPDGRLFAIGTAGNTAVLMQVDPTTLAVIGAVGVTDSGANAVIWNRLRVTDTEIITTGYIASTPEKALVVRWSTIDFPSPVSPSCLSNLTVQNISITTSNFFRSLTNPVLVEGVENAFSTWTTSAPTVTPTVTGPCNV